MTESGTMLLMSRTARPPSLLLRLSLSALAVVLLSLGLIGLAVDRAFRAAEEAALRERLESAIFAVLAGLEVGDDGQVSWAGAPADSLLTQPQSGLYAGVFTPTDAWYSPSTLGIEPPVRREPIERGSERFLVATEDRPMFVYRLGLGWETAAGDIVDLGVWVAEDRARTREAIASFRDDLWRWLGLAALVLVIAQLVLLAQPVLVLRRVAGEVREVEAGRRDSLGGRYPRELQPLTENLNALLGTERANAEQYSRALADLAHSLKTPLAVLNSQIDAGERPGPDELRETVSQMQARIRAELDRAARSGRRTMLAAIDPAPIAERLARSLEKLYPDTSFDVISPPDLRVNVAERDLYELLGNLLENAAKYGGGRVRLRCEPLATGGRRTGLRLRVSDDGPGIEAGRFEAMLQRGVRGDELTEGQGLGLAIVRRIVDSYSGRIRQRRSDLGGLEIEVELKPA
jgi:two-component system sensor histidine kinase PhoQ